MGMALTGECAGVWERRRVGAQECRRVGTRIEVQKCRSAEIEKCGSVEVQEYRSTEVQKYRSTGVQKYRSTEVQKYRSTEVQKYLYGGFGWYEDGFMKLFRYLVKRLWLIIYSKSWIWAIVSYRFLTRATKFPTNEPGFTNSLFCFLFSQIKKNSHSISE